LFIITERNKAYPSKPTDAWLQEVSSCRRHFSKLPYFIR
jgi:hypothetical protein